MSFQENMNTIKDYLNSILPGQKIKHLVPSQVIWDNELNDYNWDFVEEIQMLARGTLSEDIFVTLRFNNKPDLLVDMYRLPGISMNFFD